MCPGDNPAVGALSKYVLRSWSTCSNTRVTFVSWSDLWVAHTSISLSCRIKSDFCEVAVFTVGCRQHTQHFNDGLTWPHWGGQTAPAVSTEPPLLLWRRGGHFGLSGHARSSEPQTARSQCLGPYKPSRKRLLQSLPLAHTGYWCRGPWPRSNRLRQSRADKSDVKAINYKNEIIKRDFETSR